MRLGLNISHHQQWCVVDLSGELDLTTAPTLRQKIVQLVAAGERFLILDLSGVDFIDSAGLGTIVAGLKRCRTHDGELELICPQANLRRVFEIVDLDRVFSLHVDLDHIVAEARS